MTIRIAAKTEVFDIAGVIDALGVCGSKSQGNNLWTMVFTFDAWKLIGKEIQRRKLTIQQQVDEKKLNEKRKLIEPYDVIHIRARLEGDYNGVTEGVLVEILEKCTSEEDLNKLVHELQEPDTFEDELFGVFTLDRRVNWYEATTKWLSAQVQLSIPAAEDDTIATTLELARSLWASQESWALRLSDYAVLRLLELKNKSWQKEGEGTITSDEFKNRIKLETVVVHPDSNFEFWYDDGGLFWGHAIMIGGTLTDGPADAGIHG